MQGLTSDQGVGIESNAKVSEFANGPGKSLKIRPFELLG